MPENNFEKQVQQKMDELRMKPSGEVWQKLSGIITKRKTDRRVLVLLLVLALLTGAGAYLVWHRPADGNINMGAADKVIDKTTGSNNQKPIDNAKTETKSLVVTTPDIGKQVMPGRLKKKVASPNKLPSALSINADKTGNELALREEKGKLSDVKTAQSIKEKQAFSKIPGRSLKDKSRTQLTINPGAAADTDNLEKNEPGHTQSVIVAMQPPVDKERIPDTVSTGNVIAKQQVSDSAKLVAENQVEPSAPVSKTKTSSKAQASKWKFGVNFSVGISAMRNAFLGIGNRANDLAGAYSSPGQVSGGNNGNTGVVTPSTIKPGLGLVAGVFADRSLSDRLSVQVGLNYRLYTSSMLAGQKQDSIGFYSGSIYYLNSYAAGNQSVTIKNTFHFVQIPLNLRYRLTAKNKLPVYIDGGISVSRLVAVSALQFQPTPGFYYKQNDLFNKTQTSLSLDLLFSLSRQRPNALLVGPEISFGLSAMAPSGLYEKRHYSYFGLRVQKEFGK